VLAASANVIVRVLLAPECAACHGVLETPLSSPVCPACWRAIPAITPPWCVRCGDALATWRPSNPLCPRCRRHESGFLLARSAGRYDGSLRLIIHAFKYDGRRTLASPLAALLRQAGADLLAAADAVVPVPLHPWRSLTRGFNQADDLARHLGLPVWRVLRRRRGGPPQAGLPAARRHRNVRAAFALNPPYLTLRPRHLRNRSVVLIDDVMTTGATLEACGRVLQSAGVRSVGALTVARALAGAPHRRPP
jgi:ComF family protein